MYTSIKRLSIRLNPASTKKFNSACEFLKKQKQAPWGPSSIPEYAALHKERSLSVSPCLSFAVTFYWKFFCWYLSVCLSIVLLCLSFLCSKVMFGRSLTDWEHEPVWFNQIKKLSKEEATHPLAIPAYLFVRKIHKLKVLNGTTFYKRNTLKVRYVDFSE